MSSARWIASACLGILVAAVLAAPANADTRVYVAPRGSDSAPGTAARPFATLPRALSALPHGGSVLLAPGRYPHLVDSRVRRQRVTIEAWRRRRPQLAGVLLLGATRLRLRDLRITGTVMITGAVGWGHGSADISVISSEVTAPGTCISVRGAQRIVLRGLDVHDCSNGLTGPEGEPQSRHVALLDSHLHGFSADAVQFGRWDDVRIEHDRITDISDPAGVIHNDAVQFMGGSRHVRIVDDELARSRGQLLFIQDAFAPIDDVLVRGNLVHDSGAYAIQSQGATRVRFIDNTVWHSHYGGLFLRQGMQTLPGGLHRRPRDTVVEDNILSGLDVDPYVRIARNRGNVISCASRGAGRTCASDRTFASVARGDYRLRRGGPVARLAVGPAWLRAR